MPHIQRCCGTVNETKVNVFLEFPCFLNDPENVGNLIPDSSAFSKHSLNIWEFSVHVMLKYSLEDFKHYLASIWNECNCAVVWTCFTLPFFGTEMKTDLFQSCVYCWVFQICWHIKCSTVTASYFRILNSLARIPSPSLALLAAMLLKAHLTSHSSMPGFR